MHLNFRQQLCEFLYPTGQPSTAAKVFNLVLSVLIVLNVAVLILGSIPEYQAAYRHEFRAFNLASAAFFGLEYLARLYVAPFRPEYSAGWRGRLRYASEFMPLVDLAVIVALLIPGNSPLVSLRSLRLLKVLSVLKLGRQSSSLRLIGRVVIDRSGELMSTLLIATVLMLIAASVLYQTESAAGTEGFADIPEALWWAVVTLTTTGYGDVVPQTALGRVAAGFIMVVGVGVVALPAGMIASSFADELSNRKRAPTPEPEPYNYCPHCGEKLR